MSNPNHLYAQSNKRRNKAVSRSQSMKAEYDFSKAERGKFYRKDAIFHFLVNRPRSGWDEQFRIMAEAGDDGLFDGLTLTRHDTDEWKW